MLDNEVGIATPSQGTWEAEVEYLKNWTISRLEWIEDELPNLLSPTGLAVCSGGENEIVVTR